MTNTNDMRDKIQDALKSGKNAIESSFNKTNIKQNWQEAVNEAKDTFDATKRTAKDAAYIVRDKSQKWNQSLCECISNNPWKSVLIAGLTGWLVGKFNK